MAASDLPTRPLASQAAATIVAEHEAQDAKEMGISVEELINKPLRAVPNSFDPNDGIQSLIRVLEEVGCDHKHDTAAETLTELKDLGLVKRIKDIKNIETINVKKALKKKGFSTSDARTEAKAYMADIERIKELLVDAPDNGSSIDTDSTDNDSSAASDAAELDAVWDAVSDAAPDAAPDAASVATSDATSATTSASAISAVANDEQHTARVVYQYEVGRAAQREELRQQRQERDAAIKNKEEELKTLEASRKRKLDDAQADFDGIKLVKSQLAQLRGSVY